MCPWDPTAHTPNNNIENDPPPPESPSSVIESLLFLYVQTVDENPGTLLQVSDQEPRIGTSSEWAGNPQPKKFLDFVFMTRSKVIGNLRTDPFYIQYVSRPFIHSREG